MDHGGSSLVQTRSVSFKHKFDFLEFAHFVRAHLRQQLATASDARGRISCPYKQLSILEVR